jgi:hypothetical protein
MQKKEQKLFIKSWKIGDQQIWQKMLTLVITSTVDTYILIILFSWEKSVLENTKTFHSSDLT